MIIVVSNNAFLQDNIARPILTVPLVFLFVSIPAAIGVAHYFTLVGSADTRLLKMVHYASCLLISVIQIQSWLVIPEALRPNGGA